MNHNNLIYVAGHNGMVGSAIVRKLKQLDYNNLLLVDKSQLDLTNQQAVNNFFASYRPEFVFLAAAKVGGIQYNQQYAADFIRDNLLIQTNTIDAAYKFGCKKLCFLGSACIYPKFSPVPIEEKNLLNGYLEPTNEAYAVAKIAGYMMCKKYTTQYNFSTISVMPTNLYGINDNFKLNECHVIPALIHKLYKAKTLNLPYIECFGDGLATREFLHVDDFADALIYLMNNYNDPEIINIGTGLEISIKELVLIMANIMEYRGDILWNASLPNGTPRRSLNIDKLSDLGWKSQISLQTGLQHTIQWFIDNYRNKIRI
jgi:GDP-L-fucose synthase